MTWYEWQELYADKLRTPLSIVFGEVATHNHFVLDRGGKVFKQTAPVIKLPAGSTEAQHLALIAQLNSSTACFWLKQVCHCKGYGAIKGGGRITSEPWEDFFQFNGTKLEQYPLAATRDAALERFAAMLDRIAHERVNDSPRATIDAHAAAGPRSLAVALESRRLRDLDRLYRMVGLQEELDWLCYKLYGLAPDVTIRSPERVPAYRPGLRPFEIALAREDAERRATIARGEEPDEAPTAWFERHGWVPATTLDELPESERVIVVARMTLAESGRNIGLIEQPTYKRRWYRPDYAAEEREALKTFLAEKLEAWAKQHRKAFTVAKATAALQTDPAVLAAAEVLTETATFDLERILEDRIAADAVPVNKHHVFKPNGLVKRSAWEETWELQRREDAGEKVTPPVPPKYTSGDYRKPVYWKLRGALDVPKERFLALTSVPGEPRYAWAGLTPRQRVRLFLELDERLEDEGVSTADRIGLLYDAWFLLPYVAWESEEAAREFRSIVVSLVGKDGVTEKMLAEWAETHPANGTRAMARKGTVRKRRNA